MHADTPAIAWVHRKSRRLGNFSMEATYRRFHAAWKEHPPTEYTVSGFSKGILPRWRIRREVRELDAVFHYIPLEDSKYAHQRGWENQNCPISSDISQWLVRLPLFTS